MKWPTRYLIVLSLFLSPLTSTALHALEGKAKRAISWNVSSLKEVFSPHPSQKFSSTLCVWQSREAKIWPLLLIASSNDSKQSLFDPETASEVRSLDFGPLLQLVSLQLQEERYIVGLSKEGKNLIWIEPLHPENSKLIHIPVYYPIKRVAFYNRVSDGRLFLFGVSTLGTVLTQLEVDLKKGKIVPLRAFDLQEDFLEKAVDIICDDEFGRVYVAGERGRLACWDADPEGNTKPVLFLENLAAHNPSRAKDSSFYQSTHSKWMLIKTEAKKGDKPSVGSIALIERPSMRVMLWARGLDEVKPSRILTLVGCKELISIDSSYENGIIGLDLEGRICLFDDHDFSLTK